MKEKELRENSTCSICNKKILHTGLPLFWTAHIKRHGIKADAIKRQAGLEMMLGNVWLAQMMGPDEDMTETITDVKVVLCEECAEPLMRILQKTAKEE